MTWLPNSGHAPVFFPPPNDPEAVCPPDLFGEQEAANARVRVRLRNGRQPDESWPVIGRPKPTRWSLTGHDFDIVEWRRA